MAGYIVTYLRIDAQHQIIQADTLPGSLLESIAWHAPSSFVVRIQPARTGVFALRGPFGVP